VACCKRRRFERLYNFTRTPQFKSRDVVVRDKRQVYDSEHTPYISFRFVFNRANRSLFLSRLNSQRKFAATQWIILLTISIIFCFCGWPFRFRSRFFAVLLEIIHPNNTRVYKINKKFRSKSFWFCWISIGLFFTVKSQSDVRQTPVFYHKSFKLKFRLARKILILLLLLLLYRARTPSALVRA